MRTAPLSSLWKFACVELTPYSGRDKVALRFVVVSALVITLSMTLQVPFVSLSLIMTFFTIRENTVLTRVTGIIMMLGGTLGICVSLALLSVSVNYPLIRIILSAVIMFAGMYFFRVSKLGVIGFILAVLVCYSQSLVDITLDIETLVRMILWAWIAALYPIVIIFLVNTLIFPVSSETQLRRVSLNIIDIVIKQLEPQKRQKASAILTARDVLRLTLSLQKSLTFLLMSGERCKEKNRQLTRYARGCERLLNASQLLPYSSPTDLPEERNLRAGLQSSCLLFKQAIFNDSTFVPTTHLPGHSTLRNIHNEALKEIACVLIELVTPLEETCNDTGEQDAPIPFLNADVWTNPNYARFAVKCVLATLLCYGFYSAVDWPGIHSAMLTCIILALPSVGAITHKGVLRLIGCVLGGITALFAMVLVVPYIDSIVGLLLVSLPFIFMSAWIAAGSERSAYIGVQMAFTFSLSMFDQFGPAVSLTEVRDRIVGVLLGITVSTFIYSYLWPERESQQLKTTKRQLYRLFAKMVTLDSEPENPEERALRLSSMRIKGWQLLDRCDELLKHIKQGRRTCYSTITDTSPWVIAASNMLNVINQLQMSLDGPERGAITPLTNSVAAYFNAVADIQNEAPLSHASLEKARGDIEHHYLVLNISGSGNVRPVLQRMQKCLHLLLP